jgi:hypothetical protein
METTFVLVGQKQEKLELFLNTHKPLPQEDDLHGFGYSGSRME